MPRKPAIARRRPRSAQQSGIESLVGVDVEVRTGTGGCYRGTLEQLSPEFLDLRKTSGHHVLVARSAVVAIVEEQCLPSASGVVVSRGTGEP